MTRFGARLSATGVTSLLEVSRHDCEDFVWAPSRRSKVPALSTVHLRRTALLNLFATVRTLEVGFVSPALDVKLPSKTVRQVRPLTDAEVHRVRVAAAGRGRGRDRAVLAVALSEATATTGELAQVRWRDLDVATGVIALPGADPIVARWSLLSSWGQGVVKDHWRELRPSDDEFVISRLGAYGDAHCAQAAMANLVTKVMTGAGVTGVGARPSSLRLWGARQVLLTSGIEAAATALGVASLDVARQVLRERNEL